MEQLGNALVYNPYIGLDKAVWFVEWRWSNQPAVLLDLCHHGAEDCEYDTWHWVLTDGTLVDLYGNIV